MDIIKIRHEIDNFIPQVKSADDIYNLFKLLNYPEDVIFPVVSKRKIKDFDFKEDINKEISNVYTILSFGKNIPVFLFECKSLKASIIRYITKVLAEKYIRFLLILTCDYETITFLFPEDEKIRTGEHKIKITTLNINKNDLYWTDIDTLANLYYEGKEESWRDVWRKWREAFSVERVTEKFFEDYKTIFFLLRKEFIKQNLTRKQSHEFTLQLLNRIMFIYFVSKKGWLNKDTKFMKWLWKRYLIAKNKGETEADSFYDIWLKQIFFKAFNNRKDEITDLPNDVKEVLLSFPYLNGGLFTKNDIDELSVEINDSLFKTIFNFFERYNFTIKEDMPLEQEVAVDPQMLGYVYESLANVAEEIYDRNDMGIFYTPRVEVDFMCRRSLVEYISKNLPEIPKEYVYKFVFDEDKQQVENYFEKKDLWRKMEECLDNLSVVDPACGSGAFLVGMLNVLYELYQFIYKHIPRGFSDFSLKEEIIGRSLYGVDVMEWAAHTAELRLWLQLIIETELSQEELNRRALLPNLNLNIRVGDSVVQEIGGLNFQLRNLNISERLKRKLYALKAEKEKYFHNLSAKFQKKEEFIEEEAQIFKEIIEDRISYLFNEIRVLEAKIFQLKRTKQFNLYGDVSDVEQKKLFDERKDLENSISRIKKQIGILSNIKEALKDPRKKPFVWDIDFAEIFGDKGGFDIVIGNPPYVRQEKISPPNRLKNEITLEDRKEYKDCLIKSVKSCFPIIEKIDRKSDYYIYFYFHGLSILNEKGTFCFITSNSWLDVGFGKDLQEFLLKYVPIIAIYDNPKRSFKHSAINTVIALFHAPKFQHKRIFGLEYQKHLNWHAISNTAKFVMFKKPFAEVISSKNLIDIENIKTKVSGGSITELVSNIVRTEDYRVFPVRQGDLLEDGWEYPEDYDKSKGRFRAGKYGGTKWGGKYLRAPDILLQIFHNNASKLVDLKEIVKIDYGTKPGKVKFFYLNEEIINKFGIEDKYIHPMVTSSQNLDSIKIKISDTQKVFSSVESKNKMRNTGALKYIIWGEKNKMNKGASVESNRPYWYSLNLKPFDFLLLRFWDRRFWTPISTSTMYCSDNFNYGFFKQQEHSSSGKAILNSTFYFLQLEVMGRTVQGQGVLTTYVYDYGFIKIPRPELFKSSKLEVALTRLCKDNINDIFTELGFDQSKPIREQEPNPLPERAQLDNIIFDELGLSSEERKEVYYAICELVKQRLDKAKSFKGE